MANKLPEVKPYTKCRLRLLKMERIKDYLLMEEEYIKNQERMKPQDEKNEEERSQGWSLFYTDIFIFGLLRSLKRPPGFTLVSITSIEKIADKKENKIKGLDQSIFSLPCSVVVHFENFSLKITET